MANDRPENTDVLRTGDEHDEALVTYEQPGAPGSARSGGDGASWRRRWPQLLLAVGGLLTIAAMWSWASRANTPDAGQRLQMASAAMQGVICTSCRSTLKPSLERGSCRPPRCSRRITTPWPETGSVSGSPPTALMNRIMPSGSFGITNRPKPLGGGWMMSISSDGPWPLSVRGRPWRPGASLTGWSVWIPSRRPWRPRGITGSTGPGSGRSCRIHSSMILMFWLH